MSLAPALDRAETAACAPALSARPLYWPGLILALAATSIVIGILWDISWHITIGRDTFWTPAHLAIHFGGLLGGCTCGWLAFRATFLSVPEERAASVCILGARAPLGAWVVMWGAVAMLTSAPFDNWWHNAYGLDVRIISPPHVVLGLGMLAISLGALLLGLAHQNRAQNPLGDALFIYLGGIFLTLGSIFLMEMTTPNLQHSAGFYLVCSMVFPLRLVALGVAGRISWPTTRAAGVYILIQGMMTWVLPLFPAHPKLAPIFNPVTHMVPPAFPLLLVFPALAIDLILRQTGAEGSWLRKIAVATALGAAFVTVFGLVQWFFSALLLMPQADNWFLAGNRYWGYASSPGVWAHRFWRVNAEAPSYDPLTAVAVAKCILISAVGAWLGLLWGNWMKKVRR